MLLRCRKLVNVVTEIRSFYSIKEINDVLEKMIEQYTSVADEYSQWLGSILRNSESLQNNEEWTKKMGALQKGKQKPKAKKDNKKGKSKKRQTSTDWIQLKNIILSASEQGEAEILFEAIEKINNKIDQLEKVKESISLLEKSGLGKDITYITYFVNGVPEKIVLRHKEDQAFAEKFQYIADFSLLKLT